MATILVLNLKKTNIIWIEYENTCSTPRRHCRNLLKLYIAEEVDICSLNFNNECEIKIKEKEKEMPEAQHRDLSSKRTVVASSSRHRVLILIWCASFFLIFIWQRNALDRLFQSRRLPLPIPRLRSLVLDLRDFGAVGDGRTLNTASFEAALLEISKQGGGQLNVPAGDWLTAPFNLTSHFTLFLARNAIILAIDVCYCYYFFFF